MYQEQEQKYFIKELIFCGLRVPKGYVIKVEAEKHALKIIGHVTLNTCAVCPQRRLVKLFHVFKRG